jgi:hypothetical protein
MAGRDPLANPSPGSKTPAYPEHGPNGVPSPPADGSQVTDIIGKSGRGGRPAPKVRQLREQTSGRWKSAAPTQPRAKASK